MQAHGFSGLLYLGSGLGLLVYRRIARPTPISMTGTDKAWLAGAIAAGGVVGPVLLMVGLSRMPASGASLLLNAEGVFTTLLAWFAFGENFDRRIALGMLSILAGAVFLSWPASADFGSALPALTDATFIALTKGLVAGATNTILALAAGAAFPALRIVAAAAVLVTHEHPHYPDSHHRHDH